MRDEGRGREGGDRDGRTAEGCHQQQQAAEWWNGKVAAGRCFGESLPVGLVRMDCICILTTKVRDRRRADRTRAEENGRDVKQISVTVWTYSLGSNILITLIFTLKLCVNWMLSFECARFPHVSFLITNCHQDSMIFNGKVRLRPTVLWEEST